MASISFTDGTGAATLSNGRTAPFDRFANWVPDVHEEQDTDVGLGTGVTHAEPFRTDYIVSFEIDKLPASQLAVAIRLKRWLLGGDNTCTVTVSDGTNGPYACRIRPGTVPEIILSDRKLLRYTMRLELKNDAAAPLLCAYGIL